MAAFTVLLFCSDRAVEVGVNYLCTMSDYNAIAWVIWKLLIRKIDYYKT